MLPQLLTRFLPLLFIAASVQAETSLLVERECKRIANKLASVSYRECLDRQLEISNGVSVNDSPILVRNFSAGPEKKQGKVLLIGGIHGDEYASVTIIFKWLALLDHYNAGLYQWRVVPLLNPDGLLQDNSQRANASGRDLDRSFPDAINDAAPADAPESQWLTEVIRSYRPDAIVAVHAPHEVVDYAALENGEYAMQRLTITQSGHEIGSFSRFADTVGIPLLTVELPYADIMPSSAEVVAIWQDILEWIRQQTE